MKTAFRVTAALVVVALALVAVLHTAPVRRYVLRRASATLEERLGIRLDADALSYNLVTLQVSLAGVRVAAARSAGEPFFTAGRVAVTLQQSAVFGAPAIESMTIDDARIRIVRDDAGLTNLPPPGRDGGDTQPLDLESLAATRVGLEIIDRGSRTSLVLPDLDLTLRSGTGRLELRAPGRFARGDVTTTVQSLRGGVAFDGRRVRLSRLELRTDELAATLDGTVALLVADPRLDMRAEARADVARLARWGGLEDPPHGRLDLRGDVAGPLASPLAAVTFESPELAWRGVTVTGVAGATRATAERILVERLRARVAGGRVTADGTVPLGDGDIRLALAWDALDIERLASMAGLPARPRPSGRASGSLEAHGPRDDLTEWVADARLQLGGGATTRNRLALTGRLAATVQHGRWAVGSADGLTIGGVAVRPTLGGRIDFDEVGGSTIGGLVELPPAEVGQVVDMLRRAGLAAIDVATVEGSVEAQAQVTGTLARPLVRVSGAAHVADAAPLAPGTPLGGPANVSFESDLRTARIKASLPELSTIADATIDLGAPYAAHVEVTATDVPLERALRGIETPVPVTGTFSATAQAAARLEQWRNGRVEVAVAALDARAGALALRLASPARASVAAQVADVASLELVAGEVRVSAAGQLSLTDPADPVPDAAALQVTATGDLAQFLRAIAATGLVELPDVSGSGPAALLARVTGSALQPRVTGDLELGPGTVQVRDLPPATNVTVRLHSDGTWIALHALAAEWQGSRVSAQGRVPLAWAGLKAAPPAPGNGTLTARFLAVTPTVLEPFVEPGTLNEIAGSLDVTLQVQSPSLALTDVSGELRLDRMELRIADLPIAQREPTRIVFRDGFAEVESWRWTGQGGSADVQGRVGLTDRQAALIADGRFDLRMLTPFTRDAGVSVAGSFEPRLSITGALDSLRIDGAAAIVDGDVRLANPRVVATDLNGQVVLTRSRAQLTSLVGTINGGRLSGRGTVDYGPSQPVDAALGVTVTGMAVEFPEGPLSELNADLGLTANVPAAPAAEPAGHVRGTVTVVRGAYREPIAVMTGLLTALRTRRLTVEAALAEPSLIDTLALDVRVVTDDEIIVDNNLGRLALGADLRLIGTVAAPALSGRAQLAEGGELFLGRNRYEIRSGTIDFANPVAIEPELNVVATTRAGGTDIELTIAGTPEEPRIELESTSNPQLSEADIASLLLTGRRLDEISGDEAEIVSEQALAYLSGDVLGFAGRAVGLDTIRLGGVEESSRSGDPFAVATEVDPTARLTFGKSIGRNLDVVFSQSLRDGDAQTWIVDYRPRRQLELRLVSDDENLRSYELRHDVSFGGVSLSEAPAARSARERQPRVGSVTVTGSRVPGDERLRRILGLEPGDTFDFAAWQRDRDRLETALHREGFYEARIAARRDGDEAVALTYVVDEGPRCAIETIGDGLDDDTKAAIRRAWIEAVFDDFLVEEAQAIVRARLTRDGYLQATVAASLASDDGRKTLTIRADWGPRIADRVVRFDGVEGPPAAALREWAAARPAAAEATADPAAFERTLTAWLRAQGYVRAKVAVGAPLVDAGQAVLPVSISTGPAFTVADVRLDGVSAVEMPDAIDTIGLPPGTPFDPAAVDAARDRLQTRYRRDGFSSARVDARPSIDEQAGTVIVTFLVSEGPRQVLRDIRVSGNRAIDADVITRALDLHVGEPVGLDRWLQARRRVFETGLFRRVDITPEPVEEVSPASGELPMRAQVIVQEWPALRLRYGFQVAEERPEGEVEGRRLAPGLSADLTRRTLFGRAVTLGAALDYQRREQSGRGFIRSRTMFGWPIESSFVVERSREESAAATLVTELTVASWEQGVRLSPDVRLSYAYRFERNRTFDTEALPGDEFAFDLTLDVATLNGTVAWDTRDDVADSSRGWLLSSSVDYAPGQLGADLQFVRYLGQAYYFRPWRGAVIASAARFGVAVPLAGQDLAPSERYFAGGPRTVRGVGQDAVGPRTALGEPAGGESLLVLNQEIRFPIYRWLRGVGFVDAGNVFPEASGFRIGDLVGAYGAGLRLATPFALFRVDYGRLFDPTIAQPHGRWFFGLGQAF